jgi:uncharacterized protein YjbJ (UPF0337 family)
MNWNQIKDNWNEVSDKIKLTWGKLSEDDITTIAGQRDQFARLLQERYGYEQENAENAVDQFAQRLDIHPETHHAAPVVSNTN